MHPYSLFSSFFIIAGTFALLMVLMLIALLVKHKDVGKSLSLSSLRNFILCFFGIILLYYYTSYVGIHTGVFQRGVISRLADFSLFILLQYFWFVFIRTHLSAKGENKQNLDRMVNYILAGLLILSDFSCVMFLDDNFYAADPTERILAMGIEALLCMVLCVFNILYALAAVRVQLEKDTRNFILIVSFLIFSNGLLNEIFTMRLMSGHMSYVVESFYYDPTSLIMILTAISILIYLFKHDFSPVYFMERGGQNSRIISDEEVLDQLAEEYGLSKREREIAEFIFNGDSYEEIAENLFISKLTVKKHVHNLYEKLDVSKRMDLINKVRQQKSGQNEK